MRRSAVLFAMISACIASAGPTEAATTIDGAGTYFLPGPDLSLGTLTSATFTFSVTDTTTVGFANSGSQARAVDFTAISVYQVNLAGVSLPASSLFSDVWDGRLVAPGNGSVSTSTARTTVSSYSVVNGAFASGQPLAVSLGLTPSLIYGGGGAISGTQTVRTTGFFDISYTYRAAPPPPPPAVPEPATWLMMVAGFGLVGAGLRRRRDHLACQR